MNPRPLTYGEIKIGDVAALSLRAAAETVDDYARLTGDLNPVHLDEDYAARSFFKKRVAHGLLAAGLISAVLGTRLPGPGTIYLRQELDFKGPVFLGETITARAQVLEKFDRQEKIKLRTWVENQDGRLVMDGSALILFRPTDQS
ncbi:MAG: MaoC family dehydratase [Candidatus Adiutrix sp.]|jgi:3-hydroxybutyryl-CoA dehydratase|nr:MaoC family dehydratase [Candidatus Adiutrix sp.]